MQEEGHRAREQLCVGQQRTECCKEDAQAAGDDNDKGHEQEDADVVRNLAGDGARTLDVPNGVECFLDVRGQREQSIKQEYQANADEDAALGVLQVGVHKVENGVDNVGIPRK